KRFIYCILGRLRVVENDSRKSLQSLVDISNQLVLDIELTLPGRIIVRLQSHVKLSIEEADRIGAIVRTTMLRAHHGDLGVGNQNVANLQHDLTRLFKRDCIKHNSADPERAFVEVRHEFAADKGNEAERR